MKHTKKTFNDPLESVDFFDKCQCYRIADPSNQSRVIEQYEALKQHIRDKTKYLEMYEALNKLANMHPDGNPLDLIKLAQSLLKEIEQ